MVVVKNRNDPEPPHNTQPFKTVGEKYSCTDVSIIIPVHGQKDIYSDQTDKSSAVAEMGDRLATIGMGRK